MRPLSRDHHRALEAALVLKRADAEGAARAAASFLEFWRGHGIAHFRIEEEVLLPEAARCIDPTDPRMVRVLTDHVEIRSRADALGGAHEPEVAELNQLGEILAGHVRHEERILFPLIERELSAEALDRVLHRIEDAEAASARARYSA